MSIEQWWNVTDGKTEVLAEKHFPVPLYPPQKFVRSGPGSNPALRGQTPATNRLNRNTALKCNYVMFYISARTAQKAPHVELRKRAC